MLLGKTRKERDARMQSTLLAKRKAKAFQVLSHWTSEDIAVFGPGGDILLAMERAAAPLFGIITYGAQLIAYVNQEDGLYLWVQRRAKHKRTFPGLLDSTVGGRIRTGELPFECLVREAEEESSIPSRLIREGAIAVGSVSYLNITDERSEGEKGLLCPDVRLIYDLELPKGFSPSPNDGEVEEFSLLSVGELQKAMATGQCTNALIFIDFFIRKGVLTYENEPDYLEIISRLHRNHSMDMATCL